MGHGNIKDKDVKGENLSTVGVDIGDLVLQKGNKKVVFRTWDFGGQVRSNSAFHSVTRTMQTGRPNVCVVVDLM